MAHKIKFDDKGIGEYTCYKVIFKFVKSVEVDLFQGIELSLGRTESRKCKLASRDRRRVKEATRIPGSSSVPSAHVAVPGSVCVGEGFFLQSSFLSPSQENPSRRSICMTPELKSMPDQAVLRSDYEMGSNQSM